MAKNISIVYLLNVPLEDDLKNTLYFSSSSAQHTYFENNIGKSYTNVSYQAEDRTFRCPDQLDTVRQYNYIMWQNTAYSNKWFYAFIKEAKYVSDGYTDIIFEVDPLQTFMFDITVMPSFIEREHTNNDTVGNNTLPENVELGEYVLNGTPTNNYLSTASSETNASWICFQVSDFPDGAGAITPSLGDDVLGKTYGGVYSGLTYLFVLLPEHANRLIKCYDKANKANAIVSIFTVPLGLVSAGNLSIVNHTDSGGNMITIGILTSSTSTPFTINTTTLSKPSTIDGYTPKNKKLLTYPYAYFYATNNSGSEVVYHWEDFSSNPSFQVDGTVCQGMSIKAFPTNYKKGTGKAGYNYGINCGKLPICAWNSDYYTNWLTQNAVNQPLAIASSVSGAALSTIGSLMSGNVIGASASIANGMLGVGQAVARKYEASITPDQAKGNANCGDLNVAETRMGFTFYPMSVKTEYAQIIDDYFNMAGYATNRVKTPNVAHRQNWWYTKTINANIVGNVPNNYMNKIKDAYNNGLTFWRNPANFLNYSVSNGIV